VAMTAADLAKQKQEAERQAVERLKASVEERIGQMKAMAPLDAERAHAWIKQICTDKRMPMDYKKKALDRARSAECFANMRATDKAMETAMQMAHIENLQARGTQLALARQFFSKACSLGADAEFRAATQRAIDTAMLTGGVYKPGQATKAKPLDTAPKNPHQAKIPTPTSTR